VLMLLWGTPAFCREAETVTYWHVGSYDEVIYLRQLAEKFEGETGIPVHVQPIPWGNFRTKYLTAMAAGQPPDAGSASTAGGLNYGKVGGVLDLQEHFPEAVARLKANIFPDMWPACYFRGHLFSIPLDSTALIGFYRKDIFEAAGWKVPETWEELDHVLQQITADGRQYGFIWTRNATWGLGTFVWPYDTDAFSKDGLQVNWNDPHYQKGFQFAVHLWNGFNLFVEKPVEMFSLQDAATAPPLFFDLHQRYSEILVRAPEMKDNLGIFPFPRPGDAKAATMMGGRMALIFRDGKHPDEAMQWIEFLLSKESQLFKYKFMGNLGERSQMDLSVNREVWEEDLGMLPGHQDAFLEVFNRMNTRQGFPWLDEAGRNVEQSLYKMQDAVLQHFKSVSEKHDMSITEYKAALWGGEYPEEEEEYRAVLRETCETTLAKATQSAQDTLEQDRAVYEQFFGQYLESGGAKASWWDVLNTSELVVALMLLAAIGYIVVNRQAREKWVSYVFIAPPLLLAMVFVCIPIIVSLYLSFTKYNPIMPLSNAHWVGFQNYSDALQSPVLWQSLARSVYFAALVLPTQLVVSVILAACLDKQLWPDRIFKFMYFSPLVTSVVSVSLIWFALYVGQRHGWINSFLLEMGVVDDPIYFLKDKGTFLNCVIIMSVWQGLAFTILIFLAGLQNVPNQQYEAASIDGAGAIRQFFHISLPCLKPQFAFLIIMGSIGAVQVFEQIFMLGGGAGEAESKFGPDDSGMTIVPFIYRKGFEYFKMGEASAIAFILFVLLFFVTFFNLRMSMKRAR
jgi:multiple sugar transport system permease protein